MNIRKAAFANVARAGRLKPLAALALTLPFSLAIANAQPPRLGGAIQVEGRVQTLTTAPMGEVDGAVLDDGTVVHWPPHMADRFAAIAGTRERIRVTGRTETGPAGDTHLEVQTVTNLRTSASAENDNGPPPPPPGLGRRPAPPPRGSIVRRSVLENGNAQAKTAQGRIRSMTTAPMGEVDGAVLDDGTVIHWPPHLADRFKAVLAR